MLSVGEPIPWDLCNRQGKIVFRKGFVVNTEVSRERILGMKLRTSLGSSGADATSHPQEGYTSGPLRAIDELADKVSELFTGICLGLHPELSELQSLVESATALCARHPDTCLAALHFNHGRSRQSLHAIYSLFLTQRVANRLSYEGADLVALTGAALTANLGMFEFQDEWAHQSGPLTDEQNRIRLQHPERSVERLQTLGVNDTSWLQIVRQHHELADGSGYPLGLSEADILEGARLVGLVDFYLALVLPRIGRPVLAPGNALKKIYEDEKKYGKQIAETLIKVIGVYPPGTTVKLASGEIAVVVRRNKVGDTLQPQVAVVRQKDNRYSVEQPVRDTGDKPYRIVGVYSPVKGEMNQAYMIKVWD